MAKATLAAEGAAIIPATATLYCMGVEVLTVQQWEVPPQHVQSVPHAAQPALCSGQAEGTAAGLGIKAPEVVQVDLSALDAYR